MKEILNEILLLFAESNQVFFLTSDTKAKTRNASKTEKYK